MARGVAKTRLSVMVVPVQSPNNSRERRENNVFLFRSTHASHCVNTYAFNKGMVLSKLGHRHHGLQNKPARLSRAGRAMSSQLLRSLTSPADPDAAGTSPAS